MNEGYYWVRVPSGNPFIAYWTGEGWLYGGEELHGLDITVIGEKIKEANMEQKRKTGHYFVTIGNEAPQVAYYTDGKWYITGCKDSLEDRQFSNIPDCVPLEDCLLFADFVDAVHRNAEVKGWHDSPRSALEIHALIHSEISEATEECRNGQKDFYVAEGKPEGEAVELVDAVIRIADYFGSKGWDLEKIIKAKMSYNEGRPYRHGGKRF